MSKHIITKIEEGSIAEEVEILVGDELLTINGNSIEDVLDFKYLEKDEEVELVLFRESTNEEWEIFIEKDEVEEIGLEFESGLMDEYKSCTNNCVFCFIDQLPKGMRETMYFKDDDARLSFLQGNYITLTNMKDKDFDRVINYRLSPINVSIHAMNMDLRIQMLKNRFAGNLLGYMDRLYEAELVMNGQIVLCKGINDKDELEYSIQEMMKYLPYLQSVSVVPVGLSKFRDHLTKLEAFTKEEAKEVIDLVDKYQKIALEEHDLHFIHAGDEFYFTAQVDRPNALTYDGYLQYENGVGMSTLLIDEFNECYNDFDFEKLSYGSIKEVTLLTGEIFKDELVKLSDKLVGKDVNVKSNVIGITNDFFGHNITVSGLVTGSDIVKQLEGKDLGDRVYIPQNMLKSDEDIFLDDMTLKELENKLNKPVIPLLIKGERLFEAMIGKEINYE